MLLALLTGPGAASAPRVDGSLHQLSGAQIRTRFVGKVLTDGTHWRETYATGGKLLIEEMGHAADTGSWCIKGDRLCRVRPEILDDCYVVGGGRSCGASPP